MSTIESKKIENAVAQFDDFAKRLEQHANLGIDKLCESAFKSKLKSRFLMKSNNNNWNLIYLALMNIWKFLTF